MLRPKKEKVLWEDHLKPFHREQKANSTHDCFQLDCFPYYVQAQAATAHQFIRVHNQGISITMVHYLAGCKSLLSKTWNRTLEWNHEGYESYLMDSMPKTALGLRHNILGIILHIYTVFGCYDYSVQYSAVTQCIRNHTNGMKTSHAIETTGDNLASIIAIGRLETESNMEWLQYLSTTPVWIFGKRSSFTLL